MDTPNLIPPTKFCNNCKRDLPATFEFWPKAKNRRGETILSSQCKDCTRARAKKWAQDNAERNRARVKQWRDENPEKSRQSAKEYYESNKDKRREYDRKNIEKRRRHKQSPEYKAKEAERRQRKKKELRDYNREYRRQHPEIYSSATRKWREKNPEKAKALMHKRIAARKGAPGSYTDAELKAQHEKQGDRCFYCGITLFGEYEVDHVQAISRGGSNGAENIVCACKACNLSKGKKAASEWQAMRGW